MKKDANGTLQITIKSYVRFLVIDLHIVEKCISPLRSVYLVHQFHTQFLGGLQYGCGTGLLAACFLLHQRRIEFLGSYRSMAFLLQSETFDGTEIRKTI